MRLNEYKEFKLFDRVVVKKEYIRANLSGLFSINSTSLTPIYEYIFFKRNLLTIASIEYDPASILQIEFRFKEADGILFYGHFIKYISKIKILEVTDF